MVETCCNNYSRHGVQVEVEGGSVWVWRGKEGLMTQKCGPINSHLGPFWTTGDTPKVDSLYVAGNLLQVIVFAPLLLH